MMWKWEYYYDKSWNMCNLWYFGYLGNISNDHEPNKFAMTDYNVYFNMIPNLHFYLAQIFHLLIEVYESQK